MRSSERLQRYKINEMRALKGTDGPCFPAACNVCSGTSGFVCGTEAERLRRRPVPRIGAAKATHLPPAFTLGPVPLPYAWGPLSQPPRQVIPVAPSLSFPLWSGLSPGPGPALGFIAQPSAHPSLGMLMESSFGTQTPTVPARVGAVLRGQVWDS